MTKGKRIFTLIAALGCADIAWRAFFHHLTDIDLFLCGIIAAASAVKYAIEAITGEK